MPVNRPCGASNLPVLKKLAFSAVPSTGYAQGAEPLVGLHRRHLRLGLWRRPEVGCVPSGAWNRWVDGGDVFTGGWLRQHILRLYKTEGIC